MEHAKLNVQLALSLRAQIILRSTLTLVLIAALALLSVLQELSPRVNTGCTGDEFKTIYKRHCPFLIGIRSVFLFVYLFCYADTFLLVSRNQYVMIQLFNKLDEP